MIWVYEGGLRGLLLIKWPGTTLPGSITEAKTISTDFYPTLLEMAGLPNREDQHTDGISIVRILKGEVDSLDRDALYWHYPNYSNQGGFPGGAIRIGDWKLIERYEDGRVHLYNVVTHTVVRSSRQAPRWCRSSGAELRDPIYFGSSAGRNNYPGRYSRRKGSVDGAGSHTHGIPLFVAVCDHSFSTFAGRSSIGMTGAAYLDLTITSPVTTPPSIVFLFVRMAIGRGS